MILMAMDRASVRRRDANGFLHVETSPISKANVCPYFGREIPNSVKLGLDPDRVYWLYRDPDELARAVATANNIPLLSEHLPVLPDQLPEHLIIGSTGTDAAFSGGENGYVSNSLVVWCGEHQRGIDAGRKKDLSSGYRYRADMTAGTTPSGLKYDGVMRDILFNHVALVFEGRAGPDVVVGDELMKLTSRTALMISGAVAAMVRPMLAQDAKVDITDALKGVDAKSFAADGAPAGIATKVVELVTPHLAADQTLDTEALTASISAIQPVALAEDTIADPESKGAPKVETTPAPSPAPALASSPAEQPQALDQATVGKMISDAEARGAARVAAIDTAKRDVEPLVGEVVGMDSAEAIYRFALEGAGYAADSIKESPLASLQAMVKREVEIKAQPIAQDRKSYTGGSKLAAIVPDLPPLIRS